LPPGLSQARANVCQQFPDYAQLEGAIEFCGGIPQNLKLFETARLLGANCTRNKPDTQRTNHITKGVRAQAEQY
jgi:hypothetical protein